MFSMRPYMCTPQPVHAWRWMAAFSSTIFSLSAFSITETWSLPTTATTENLAPAGFQHLVQPQAWLCATWAPIFTFTGLVAHLHTSVPPAKLAEPFLMPLSSDGCSEVLAGAAAGFFLNQPNILFLLSLCFSLSTSAYLSAVFLRHRLAPA